MFLPGTMLATGAWLLVDRFLPNTRVYAVLAQLPEQEWQFTLVLVLAAALLGSVSACLFSYIEHYVFDRFRKSSFRKDDNTYTDAHYDAEWDAYIDSLAEKENPYISGIATTFFFESRSSIGCIFLGIAWAISSKSLSEGLFAAGIIVLGCGLFWTANHSHRILAKYRHRVFPKGKRVG